jgi:hypothetical protein
MDKLGPDARVHWGGLLHQARGIVIGDFSAPEGRITTRFFRSRYDSRRTGALRA